MVNRYRNSLDSTPLLKAGRRPIYIVRHGQTTWNLERRFIGKSDIPLDETGITQAASVSDRLRDIPNPVIYSSPLSRASETASHIAKRLKIDEVKMVQDLAELDQGELEGRYGDCLPIEYPDFFASWLNDPTHVQIPGGETLGRCQERAWSTLNRLCAAPPTNQPIIIVTHKMVICTIICRILNLPLGNFRMIGQKNTAINLLSHSKDGLQLHRLNDIDHLNPKDRSEAL